MQLIFKDSTDDVPSEGQIKAAGQHPQAGKRFVHRPLALHLGITAVISKAPIPILKGLHLMELGHQFAAIKPLRLQNFALVNHQGLGLWIWLGCANARGPGLG